MSESERVKIFFWATPEQRRNLKLAATSMDRPYTDIVRQAFEFYESIDEDLAYSREELEPHIPLLRLTLVWAQRFGEDGPPSLDKVRALIDEDLSGNKATPDNEPKTAKERKLVSLLLACLRDPDGFGQHMVTAALEGYGEMVERLAELEAREQEQ